MYRSILVALALALVIVLVGAGFVGGFLVAKAQTATTAASGTQPDLSVPGAVSKSGKSALPDSETIIDDVRHVILQSYVEPPDPKKLDRGAIDGMIKALGDPYTAYFDTNHYRFFKEMTSGEFYGVGIQLGADKKTGMAVVIAPLDGTPAQKAGIKSGDLIVSVDGTATKGVTTELTASRIRGEAGTTVTLVIQRPGEKATRTFALKRVKLTFPNVTSKLMPGTHTGYIRVHTFDGHATTAVAKQLGALRLKGATSFIIDLRDNPGGLLQEGVDMASLFIDKGPLIIMEPRGGKRETLNASGGADTQSKIVVLVNKGSASASEIFAGAMQDRGRAKLVGEQTFGKAAVQTVVNLPDGSAIKVTSAYYLTPGGHNISKKGIKPDYVVPFKAGVGTAPDSEVARALELLK
jgi:carboxyl-terminal processing protease